MGVWFISLLSVNKLSAMTLGIITFSIMTLTIMASSIMACRQNDTKFWMSRTFIVMLKVVRLSAVELSVVMMNVLVPTQVDCPLSQHTSNLNPMSYSTNFFIPVIMVQKAHLFVTALHYAHPQNPGSGPYVLHYKWSHPLLGQLSFLLSTNGTVCWYIVEGAAE